MRRQSSLQPFACSALVVFAAAAAAQGSVIIDGGLAWQGWTSYGISNSLGVYGGGSTANQYEIYTTQFIFDNHSVTGSPTGSSGLAAGAYSTGAFRNGNRMFGIGVRWISGAEVRGSADTIVRFDFDNNGYAAASTVGGTDGRVSSTLYADRGDFNCQFFASDLTPTTLTAFSGPGAWTSLGAGAVNGDFAFRGFYQASTKSFQMIFDLTAMPVLYSNVGGNAIGTIGENFRISLRGAGNTDSVVTIPTAGGLAFAPLACLVFRRRR